MFCCWRTTMQMNDNCLCSSTVKRPAVTKWYMGTKPKHCAHWVDTSHNIYSMSGLPEHFLVCTGQKAGKHSLTFTLIHGQIKIRQHGTSHHHKGSYTTSLLVLPKPPNNRVNCTQTPLGDDSLSVHPISTSTNQYCKILDFIPTV